MAGLTRIAVLRAYPTRRRRRISSSLLPLNIGPQISSSWPCGLAPEADAPLLAALRAGDERAFAALVDKYGPSLLRLAQLYVSSRAVAEEVVQETWLAVLTGIERFEGRSSLK